MSRAQACPASQLEIDDERCDAFWKGQRLELSPESYRVLRLIACNPNKVYSPSEIIDEADIWSDVEHMAVVEQFQLIRHAFRVIELGEFPIEVIRKQGYKWNERPARRSMIARLFKGKTN